MILLETSIVLLQLIYSLGRVCRLHSPSTITRVGNEGLQDSVGVVLVDGRLSEMRSDPALLSLLLQQRLEVRGLLQALEELLVPLSVGC